MFYRLEEYIILLNNTLFFVSEFVNKFEKLTILVNNEDI